jgi:hypothetical protein
MGHGKGRKNGKKKKGNGGGGNSPSPSGSDSNSSATASTPVNQQLEHHPSPLRQTETVNGTIENDTNADKEVPVKASPNERKEDALDAGQPVNKNASGKEAPVEVASNERKGGALDTGKPAITVTSANGQQQQLIATTDATTGDSAKCMCSVQ